MKHITEYSKFNESWIGDKFHSLIDAISVKLNSRYANKIKNKIESNTPEENEKLLKMITKEFLKFKNDERKHGIKKSAFSKHQWDHLDAILVSIFGITSYLYHGFNDPLVWMWIFLCIMKYKQTIKSYNDNEENTYKEIIDYIKTSLKSES